MTRVTRFVRFAFALLCTLMFVGVLAAQLPYSSVHAQDDAPANSVGIVRGHGAILLDGSGKNEIGRLSAGDVVLLRARTGDGALLYVELDSVQAGWVAANSLLVATNTNLPVRELGETSTSGENASEEGASGTVSSDANPFVLPTPTPNPAAPLSATTGTPGNLLSTIISSSSASASAPSVTAVSPTGGAAITVQMTLTNTRLNLRSSPGIDAPIVAKAEPNSTWHVIARSADSAWLHVRNESGETEGWGSAAYLVATSGDIATAPVIQVDVAVRPIPTPTSQALAVAPAGSQTVAETPLSSAGKTGLTGKLVFQDRIGGTIFIYDLGTDTLRSLTTGIDPAISNDGTRVAFTRDGGDAGLYVINLDGSGETLVYNERPYIRSPKWSPDDSMIAFSSVIGYNDCRLLDGLVCLPDEALLETVPPEFQGPETLKALKDLPNQREFFYALARIGITGENFHDIPALDRAQAPDWNAAGITYHSSGAGIQITSDDPNARTAEVANNALLSYYQDPDWQPNGGRIVYYRQMNGRHWQIFAVNPDGTGDNALTRPVTALVDELPSNVSPAWSPDGSHIVYLSNRNSIESAGAWHLWVMDADGGNQRMLPVDVPLDFTFSSEQVVSWGP